MIIGRLLWYLGGFVSPFDSYIPRYNSKGKRNPKMDGKDCCGPFPEAKGKFVLYKAYLKRVVYLARENCKQKATMQDQIDYLIELLKKNGIPINTKWWKNI